jgi:cyclophilin family peptidyl-prolyl cis-trans isomerase/protein-disulfide isomerase
MKGIAFMEKRVLFVIVLASLLLASCGAPAATPRPTPKASATPKPTVVAQPTAGPSATALPPTVTPLAEGCATVTLLPNPDPAFPPVSDSDYTRGAADAPITFIEYADFQCAVCSQSELFMQQVLALNPGTVRLVYRYYPMTGHTLALISAQAAEAAANQGKFWEMHDALFANQSTWSVMTMENFVAWAINEAKTLGLDATKFTTDIQSQAVVAKVVAAQTLAEASGVPTSPFVLANGISVGAQIDDTILNNAIDLFLSLKALEPKIYKSCPPQVVDNTKQYFATVSTTKGDFVMQLFPDKAPRAVNSFVFLAQHGWYDGNPFYRVIPDRLAQTGDPSGTGIGNPGYEYVTESSDLKFDKEGVVGVTNAGQNTSGSLFFITYGPLPSVDGVYTIIGQVTQGMDVVKNLTARNPSNPGTLPNADNIIKVTIEVK